MQNNNTQNIEERLLVRNFKNYFKYELENFLNKNYAVYKTKEEKSLKDYCILKKEITELLEQYADAKSKYPQAVKDVGKTVIDLEQPLLLHDKISDISEYFKTGGIYLTTAIKLLTYNFKNEEELLLQLELRNIEMENYLQDILPYIEKESREHIKNNYAVYIQILTKKELEKPIKNLQISDAQTFKVMLSSFAPEKFSFTNLELF